LKASNEQEIQRLRNELQQQVLLLEQEKLKSGLSTQLISNLEQRLTDKTETINVYQTLVQAKNNEINLLKKDNQTRENTEKENLELKPKLEECQRCSQPLLDSIKSTNDDNTATTSPAKDNNAEFDNQTSLSGTRNGDIEKIKVKTETGLGNDSQLGYKKRKVSSNSS
jgi:hypothetical protein